MKLAFQLSFVLLVACVLMVDSKPPPKKPAAPKPGAPKPPAQKAPAQNAAQKAPAQNAAQKAPVQNVAQKAPVQNAGQKAPVQNAGAPAVNTDFSALLSKPEVADMVNKIKAGNKPNVSDIWPVIYQNMQLGTTSSNPSLNQVSAALADLAKALKDSPNGKLTADQATTYSDRVVDGLSDAAGSSPESRDKFKACLANGLKGKDVDNDIFQAALRKCIDNLGDGSKDGQAQAVQALVGYLPKEYNSLLNSVDIKAVVNQLSNLAPGKGGSIDFGSIAERFKTVDLMSLFNKNFAN